MIRILFVLVAHPQTVDNDVFRQVAFSTNKELVAAMTAPHASGFVAVRM